MKFRVVLCSNLKPASILLWATLADIVKREQGEGYCSYFPCTYIRVVYSRFVSKLLNDLCETKIQSIGPQSHIL